MCEFTDDNDLFSLQRQTFPFVLVCPPGYDCNGVSSFTLLCCGQSIGEVFAADASLAERLAAIQRVVQRCLVAQLSCIGGIPTIPPPQSNPLDSPAAPPPQSFSLFYNEPQTARVRCPDGSEFVYTAQAGITGASTLALANKYALAFAKLQADAKRICLGDIPQIICLDVARNIYVPANGGGLNAPPSQNFWELVSGAVPTGMAFSGGLLTGSSGSSARALISGTPSVDGPHAFGIRVVGEDGASKTREYTVCVMEVTPGFLPPVVVGVPYSQQLSVSACAGVAAWTITAGTLPAGLTISEGGLISGTPTEEPPGAITVKATVVSDDSGNTVDCLRELEFGVNVEVSEWWDLGQSGVSPGLFEFGGAVARTGGNAVHILYGTSDIVTKVGATVSTRTINRVVGVVSQAAFTITITVQNTPFVPEDVGRQINLEFTPATYTITAYISPTQVTVDASDTIAGDNATVTSFLLGSATRARINQDGDIAAGPDAYIFKVEDGGVATSLEASNMFDMNDDGDVLTATGTWWLRGGGSSVTGIGPGTGIGFGVGYLARGGAGAAPKTNRRVLRASVNRPTAIATWLDGVTTGVPAVPEPPDPISGTETQTGLAVSPNGSCAIKERSSLDGSNFERFYITDTTGYSSELSNPFGADVAIGSIRCINDSKRAGGGIFTGVGGESVAAYADGGGVMIALALTPTVSGSRIEAVNDDGWMVGGGDSNGPFLVVGSQTILLADIVPLDFTAAGYVMEAAYQISDDGYIFGQAIKAGVRYAVLLKLVIT